ncbi:hypothetical protein [Mycolicibacterium sp.]|uniref:Rv2629 family ribosome hibernation factor n=1 Tax=Mycolicibacterium sp. TaxID=2320850 RepID=UPI0037CA0D40
MHSERFRPLLTGAGPYASVYFDDSHDTADATAQLELKWRGLREELERQDAPAKVVEHLQRAVVESRPGVGRGGRGLVASPDGVLIDEVLDWAPATPVVRFSELPYVMPVIEHGTDEIPYALVAVDHNGADIEVHSGGVNTETVEGGAYPVHKAGGPETSGYGDPQPRTEEARRTNIRAVADRLTTIVDDCAPELVFVVGEVQSRSDLVAALPKRVAARVVQLHTGARHSGFDERELADSVATHLAARHRERLAEIEEQFRTAVGQGSGLAAEGLPGVCAALRAGAVETLIVGDVGAATVLAGDNLSTLAPNAEVLSELGAAPTHTFRADEALPMVAISIDADVVGDDGISPADGVAAVLRYPPRKAAEVS